MSLRGLLLGVATILPIAVGWLARPVLAPVLPPALPAYLENVPRLPLTPLEMRVMLPAGVTLGMVSWIATDDRTGQMWLLQRGPDSDPVLAVDSNGRVVHSFGKGHFKIPHSIRLDPLGNVWTVDAGSSTILKWSREGQLLLKLDLSEDSVSPPGDFGGATDIAFGAQGSIFVSDGYKNARIVEFNAAGEVAHQWGAAGAGPGQFQLPHSLVIDGNTLYVADRENGRIEEFDLHGRFLKAIAGLGRTYALALGSNGTLWASMSPMKEPPGSPGWLVEFDRRSGKALGYVPVPEPQSLHTVAVLGGEPLTDVGNGVLRFQTSPHGQPAR